MSGRGRSRNKKRGDIAHRRQRERMGHFKNPHEKRKEMRRGVDLPHVEICSRLTLSFRWHLDRRLRVNELICPFDSDEGRVIAVLLLRSDEKVTPGEPVEVDFIATL